MVANLMEVGEMLKYALEQIGVEHVVIQDDSKVNYGDRSFDLNIVIKALRKVYPERRLDAGMKVLFQTEELWNRREWGRYDLSAGFHEVLEMYDENVKIKQGTAHVIYCPVGYTPTYSMGLPEPEKKDLDILFWGSMTPRRTKICERLEKEFSDKNTIFGSGIVGRERENLIMKSKIILNIKANDRWSFGPIHILPAIANNRFVLAERADGGYGPFKPGRHFKEYDGVDDLIKKIRIWLERDEEREAFAKEALELVKKECDFIPILKAALKSPKGGAPLI